jgi:hypothetical protein
MQSEKSVPNRQAKQKKSPLATKDEGQLIDPTTPRQPVPRTSQGERTHRNQK